MAKFIRNRRQYNGDAHMLRVNGNGRGHRGKLRTTEMPLGRAVAGYHIPAESENVAVPGMQTGLFLAHRRGPNTDTADDDPAMSRLFPGDSPWGTDTRAHTTNVTTREVHGDCRRCERRTTRGPPRAAGTRRSCVGNGARAASCTYDVRCQCVLRVNCTERWVLPFA